jgi:hypothetical protein
MTAKRCIYCLTWGELAPIRLWGTAYACRECALAKGGAVGRRAVSAYDVLESGTGYTPEVLRTLAAGGIMDPNALFLPAGKVSKAEADARERAGMVVGDSA